MTIISVSVEAILSQSAEINPEVEAGHEQRCRTGKENCCSRSVRRLINLSMPGIKCLYAAHTNKSRVAAINTNWGALQGAADLFTLAHTGQVRLQWELESEYAKEHSKSTMAPNAFPGAEPHRPYLVPVFQLVVRKIELWHVSAEGSDFSFVSRAGDSTAVQHKHTGEVEAIWITRDTKHLLHSA